MQGIDEEVVLAKSRDQALPPALAGRTAAPL